MLSPHELPPAWFRLFDGEQLETKLGEAAILATTDSETWPHLAFLSVGEVYAPGRDTLYLATWPSSRTAQNLERQGQASLSAAADGAVWEARLAIRRCTGMADEAGPALFRAELIGVRKHMAPYAQVEQLIRFRLDDETATLDRWRAQIETLRRLAARERLP